MIYPPVPPISPEKKKRSAGKKFLLGTALTIGAVILLMVILAAFFSRQITKRILAEVGKSLKTEVKLGDADLSLLSGFPDASVNFKNVRAKDAFGGTLLIAHEVSFRFSLFSLFSNTIRVHQIVIRDGVLRIRFDKKGQPNFEILKESTSKNEAPGETALALELAELLNMTVIFQDDEAKRAGSFKFKKASFAGNFSAKRFNLDSKAEFTTDFVNLDGDRFLVNQPMAWDAVIAVDLQKDGYLLKKTELQIGDNVFSIDGAIASEKDATTNMNLKFASLEGDVSVLFSLLPASVAGYFSDFSSSGKYACAGWVRGRSGKGRRPNLQFDFSLRDGKISSPKLEKSLDGVSFKARAEMSPTEPGTFSIENFAASFDGEPFKLSLRVANFDDPDIDFSFSGALPLASAYGLFNEPKITDGEGRIVCKSLTVNGKYKNMKSMSGIASVETGGVVELQKAGVKFNGEWIEAPRGRFRLADNVLSLDTIELKIKDSDLAFSGEFRNFLPVLFADSLNSKNAAIEFAANLSSEKMDIDQLISLNSIDQKTRGGTSNQAVVDSLKKDKNKSRSRLTDLLFGTFEVKIGALNYQKIEAKNFTGKLAFKRNELIVLGDLDAMDGSLHMEGNAFFEEKPRLKARFVAKNLDLKTTFEQFENFGQEVVQEKHLRGRLDARVAVNGFWNEKGVFDDKKLRVLAELSGRDGELVGLPMLEDFSNYIHVEDLRRVRFSNLHNFMEISNRTIVLPAMFIQSNACNLTMSIRQTFDDEIDYKIKMNAGQVLMSRLKKNDGNLDPQPEKNGLFNIFYTMCCRLDNYKIRLDKKGVKSEFEKGEARKKMIATALDGEFQGLDVSLPTPRLARPADEFLPEITSGGSSKPAAADAKKKKPVEEDEYLPGF